MKAIVVGRSPGEAIPEPIALSIVPSSAMILGGKPLFVPAWAPKWAARPVLAFRLGRLGKSIDPRFARRYIDGVAAAMILRPILPDPDNRLDGLFHAFEGAMTLGPRLDLSPDGRYRLKAGEISLGLGSEALDLDNVVAALSNYMTLQMGDWLIPAITPAEIPAEPETTIRISVNDTDDALTVRLK